MYDASFYSDEGHYVLVAETNAPSFLEWRYAEVKPFLAGDILECGSGFGTYSDRLVRDFPESKITVSDVDAGYIALLRERFKRNSNISVSRLDLGNREDFESLWFKPDSVLALNVLEHVRDDVSALKNVYDILKPDGRLVLLVPAHQTLYNNIDVAIGHFRRYSLKSLTTIIGETKFRVLTMFYMNLLGIVGWYVNGTLLRSSIVNGSALHFYDKLVPGLRLFEKRIIKGKFGISLIAVLEKK